MMGRWSTTTWAIVAAVSLAGFIAIAMATTGPDEGRVTDRRYHGPWTELRSMCVSSSSNSCASRISQPVYHAESCLLRLRNGDDEGWTEVPCASFDQYAVGDYYPKGR